MINNFSDFGDDFQNQLLIQILNNDGNANFGVRFVTQSEGVTFSNDYNKRLFAIISDFVKKYNKTPHWSTLSVEIKTSQRENAEMKAILQKHLASLQKLEVYDSQSVQDNAMKFVICSNTKKLSEFLIKASDNGDVQGIQNYLVKLNDITRARLGMASIMDADDLQLDTENMRKPFPTGLGVTLDREMAGGFAKSEIILIVAGTNVGKTTAACSMALNMSRAGKKVWYVYFEDTEQQITEKLFANVSGLEINNLKKNEKVANKQWDKTTQIRKEKNGKLYAIKLSSQGDNAKIGNIIKWMESYAKDTGNPDVILFDYLGKPKSDNTIVKDEYTVTGEVFSKLETLCSKSSLEACVIVFHQSNRVGLTQQDVQYLDWAHISGDIKSAQTAHGVITLYSNAELKEQRKANALLLKSRMGNAYVKFPSITMNNATVNVEFGLTEQEQAQTTVMYGLEPTTTEPEKSAVKKPNYSK